MTPAGERFVKRVTDSAAMMAEHFAKEPNEVRVIAALEETRLNLTVELTETFGRERAAMFADRFVATVFGRRRELLLS